MLEMIESSMALAQQDREAKLARQVEVARDVWGD